MNHRSSPNRQQRLLSLGSLGVALSLFLILTLHQLNLPGFYYDEGLDLVPMLQIMHHESTELLRGIGVTIGDYTYPIMLMDYVGSLNGYLTLPFMALSGSAALAARLQPILLAAVTIVLAYALARAWFGRAVAVLTALLLAVNPSFVWFSRQGVSVTSTMTIFSLGSLLLLNRWRLEIREWRLGSRNLHSPVSNLQSPNLYLLLAGLLLGLGLWDKFLFLWWIVILGVITTVWVLTPRQGDAGATARRQRILFPLPPGLTIITHALPLVLLGFLVGAAPLIYYNLHDFLRLPLDLQNAHTLGLLVQSLGQPTEYGVNNLDVMANLGKAIADFRVFIDGSYFWYNGVPYSNVLAVPAFLASAVVGSILARARNAWRKWVALLAAMVVTVLISAFTVSGLWATHLYIIVPLPQMVVAVAAVWLSRWGAEALQSWGARLLPHRSLSLLDVPAPRRSGFLSALLIFGLLALPFSRDLWVSQQHHATLAQTGGSGLFSDAIYTLVAYLDSQDIRSPVALDWGIEKSVRVLTADKIRPVEIFGFSVQADDAFRQRARDMLKDRSQHYVLLWDRFAVYNRREVFTQIAREMGLQVTETFIAHERSGLPVYIMLQAK